MSESLEGRVAWVTGGGSGIGRAIAVELARRGMDVAISGRREDKLREVAREVHALGRKGLAVPCDVTDEDAVFSACAKVVDVFGHVDVCVANAGYSVAGRFESVTAAEWRRQLDVNVVGLASTVRAALPSLRATSGRVVLIGSVSGMVAVPGTVAYTASKYAVRAIGQVLAIELHGTGVTCTTIHPGFVESEIAQVDNEGRFDPSRTDKRPSRLMWSADRAAKTCVDAIAKREREVVFTGHGKVGAFLGQHLPGVTHFLLTRRGAKKKAASTVKG
jgi:NADP-dependent 3-hydroxy acid dehydrogenase YdfG